MLSWMKRLIGLRKQVKVFGRGTLEFLPVQNRKVLAYLRSYDGETVLCVSIPPARCSQWRSTSRRSRA